MAMPAPARATARAVTVPADGDDALDGLVQAARSGDPRALDMLLARVRPLVHQYCRARVGVHDAAAVADITQEACLAVAAALPGYRSQGKPFRAFVYGVAAHKVADQRRGAGRRRCTPVADVPETPARADGPEQRALAQERTRRLRTLLDTLPPRQREVLVLRVGMAYSAEETAQALGTRPGAVRVAQHRAMARLRAGADRFRDL
jgi:RNA polymerase sigma-70 factor (ECF subfamily)